MKNLYAITDRKGIHLCYQVHSSEAEAVEAAKMYGHRRAAFAEFIQKRT